MTAAAETAHACLTILLLSGDGAARPRALPSAYQPPLTELRQPANAAIASKQRHNDALLSPVARLHIASPSSLRLNAHRRSCAARSLRAA